MSAKEKSKSDGKKAKRSPLVRFLVKPLLILIAVIIVIAALALLFINPIAKFAIESVAPEILGVNMRIESVNVSPFKGRIEIREFYMDNPENGGYKSKYAMHFGYVNADVNINTLLNQKIEIQEITVKDVQINYETDMLSSNLQDIINNVNKLAEKAEKAEQAEEAGEPAGEDDPKPLPRLQVNHFEMDNVGLYVIAKGQTETGAGLPLTVNPIGPLGTDPEGISVYAFALHVLTAILLDSSKQGLINISDAAAEAADQLVKAGEKAINDATKKAADKIGDLFRSKKD